MKITKLMLLAGTALSVFAGSVMAQEAATVAFLMPDQASTRYEEHDYPAFRPRWRSFAPTAR
jgi:D-xylose transport system substrate-binding protein